MKEKAIAAFLVLLAFSCTRDESVLPAATFPNTPEVFTDNPVGLTDEFFVSFDPNGGANTNGFGTDDNVAYEGTSSIRIDVPSATDPDGSFIGGIFRDRGDGRDLTEYDAMTLWIKGSTTATVGLLGFGTDFIDDEYAVSRQNVQLSTDWKQITIPIPDPSKLTQEKGMFIFSAGSASTGGNGFTFWIDEIKFEKLGTLAQARPAILNGADVDQEGFIDVPVQLTGFTQTFNSAAEGDITVNASTSYFDFSSSNETVARVNDSGLVSVIGIGEVEITAQIANVTADGSLSLDVEGGFDFAPTPARDPATVVSLFSDAYTDIPVSRYNSFFEPFQTTLGGVVPIGDQSIISYTNLNFVGIVFNSVIFPAEAVSEVNATDLTHLHIDVNVQEEIEASDFVRLELVDYGNLGDDGDNVTGTYTIASGNLVNDQWVGFDIPLTDFAGLTQRSNIGLLLFVSDGTVSNILLDNIYFYTDTE